MLLLRLFSVVLLFIAVVFSANNQAQTVETTDKLTAQWLAVEDQTRVLQAGWQADRPVLEQRIRLLNAEINQLSEFIKQTKTRTNSVDEKRSQLLQQQNQLEQQQKQTETTINRLAAQLNHHQTRIAPAIAANEQGTNTSGNDITSNTAKLQYVLSRIEQLQQFNQRVGQHQGVIELNQQSLMVDQLYLGLSYAWFVSKDNQTAGYGRVVNGQWQWQAAPSLNGGSVRQALKILNNQALPQYISLPVELSAQGGSQ